MNTTLDQWEVLEAVIQSGSFAAAAAKMNRSQSTISYTVSRLQEQFKIPLLKLKGRKAQLTEAGKALLTDAEPILAAFRALEQRASALGAGGETEIRISVDSIFPNSKLFAALADLTRLYPHVRPQLRQTMFLSSVQEFASSGADLCISGLPTREYFAKPILDIRMRAVARADHPLNRETRQLTRLDLIQRPAVISRGQSDPHLRSNRTAPCSGI
jgi:DNA-binding transcriptional LysR family regulator